MKTPEELRQQLIILFPSFADEYNVDENDEIEFEYEPPLTLHRVWMGFSPMAYEYLRYASTKTLVSFVSLVNSEVAAGADRENAVSTCFLEHASQISVKKLIKPMLSAEARRELR